MLFPTDTESAKVINAERLPLQWQLVPRLAQSASAAVRVRQGAVDEGPILSRVVLVG